MEELLITIAVIISVPFVIYSGYRLYKLWRQETLKRKERERPNYEENFTQANAGETWKL